MNDELDFDELAPWLALFITLIGGFLRVFMLADKGLWLDETFSVWLANQSVPDMLQWIVKIDPHPPLYYLLLHAWTAFNGDTPYGARLLSALFGTATIPFIYLIGLRLSGPIVGLAAAAFVAFSTFNVYFAQEARMYTLLMFVAAVAIYALVRLLTDPRATLPIGSQLRAYLPAWRTSSLQTISTDLAWIGFVVFSAAALLTHNTAVCFVLAANVFVFGLLLFQKIHRTGPPPALQAPSLGNWIKAQLGILLLWSPWLWAFMAQASRVSQEFWLPAPDGNTVVQTLRSLLNTSASSQLSLAMTWTLCVVLCLGIVYYRKKLAIFLLLATLFAVPVLGELIVSVYRPIFLGRTLIWLTIPLFLLLAAGIAQLKFRLLMIMVMGLLVTNYLFSTSDYYRFGQKEDWSTAAGYVALFAEQDDLVLFNSNFVEIPFNYYFQAYEEQYATRVEKRGIPLDLFTTGVLEPKMTARDISELLSLVDGRDQVWLVYSHDSYTDPQGLIPQTLAAHMQLSRTREFYGGEVQLYVTP
jgi:uncharacterized membrane protein